MKEYDYSKGGLYFVTICINNHDFILGEIKDGKMVMNEVGKMVEKWWSKIPQKFVDIELDCYTLMPNHFHGIIANVGADPSVCPPVKRGEHVGSPLQI